MDTMPATESLENTIHLISAVRGNGDTTAMKSLDQERTSEVQTIRADQNDYELSKKMLSLGREHVE